VKCQKVIVLVCFFFFFFFFIDISSFGIDGHRKTMVEHTLNILFFPGIHDDTTHYHTGSTLSLSTTPPHPTSPSLHLPLTPFNIPSPLHLRLHIITRLSFNEQGRITHHRDFWDVKDVLGLIPGLGLAQWIASRVAARGLGFAGHLLSGGKNTDGASESSTDGSESRPLSRPSSYLQYSESLVQTRANSSRAGSERGDGDLESAKITPASLYARNALEGME